MVDKIVQALSGGKIISIDWHSVQEMLGENSQRSHECSICSNDGAFPPKAEETVTLSEEDACNVLHQAKPAYMAEIHKDGISYLPIEIRYFSVAEPQVGPWIKNPFSA
ncbi:MAG: hypothetical protein NC081_06870 [Roseburia sp.]|nr:hypothetical protein [Roseburia sp.]